MSQENVEIVRALNDAFNRGDAATAGQWIDPEIEVETWTALGAARICVDVRGCAR
ncbi:MAG TPA: hypothetical protein VN458_12720 [Solirubrobacterales bacterium]|nr:hypothetical protein [Solirubrobacterales bacterium]